VQISEVLGGYSKALYSTWLHYRPDRLLVDCGEGAATALGNNCFALERVLLTHGHIDHVSGLPGLVWARAGGMGDNEKPLQVCYPRGDSYFADMRGYLEKVRSKLPFQLEWIELEAGQTIELKSGRHVETFATRHMKSSQSLGYKIIETRRRLKPAFAQWSETQLREAAQKGEMEAMTEEYRAIKIAFGGDSLPIEPELVAGSEILVHEATILLATERRGQSHSTLDEALEVASKAQPGALVLNHISGRYKRTEIEAAIRSGASRLPIGFPIWCLRQDRLWPVWTPAETK
jgi:ribonuclease Z